MLFNSLIFTLFLPLVFAGYWLLPARCRNYWLLLASYYFYFSYNPYFLLLLIGTSVFDFWCAKKIESTPNSKKSYLTISLIFNLGILIAFKYSAFLFNTGVGIANCFSDTHYLLMDKLIIPAGLSFYTFQSISYVVDVYRGKYKPNDQLSDFLLYVSFFPHMVAGPIVRYHSLMPQLKSISYFKNINWGAFAQLVTWGYFKKMVIADNLNDVVTPVFNNVNNFSGFELIVAGFLFVIQVYCDFSGYSDIATGVAKLFNINFSLNWRRPLLSKSLREFWQRNHISITTWFRDYLYIGLGGNRVSYNRWLLNIFLVFLISGLWHGANLTFLIWGALHGLVFIAETILSKKFSTIKTPALIGHLYLILFHTLSLIAFRVNSVGDLALIYQKIFNTELFSFNLNNFKGIQDKFYYLLMMVLIGVFLLKELNEEFAWVNKHPLLYKLLKPIIYLAFLIAIFVFGDFNANTFIYFQF